MYKHLLLTSCLLFLLIFSGQEHKPGLSKELVAKSKEWEGKVEGSLFKPIKTEHIEFIVFLKSQADLTGADLLTTKEEKGRFVVERLTSVAEQTQGPILQLLQSHNARYRNFWIANMIWVEGDLSLIQSLAERNDVNYIYANPWVSLDLPASATPAAKQNLAGIEWNIVKIRAPEVWEKGFLGKGVVIGGQDTGYEWQHPALKEQYRGWNGTSAQHDYNWHDAIHSGYNNCSPDSQEPCDDHGHGTHTMGIMVGDDGAGNRVGVAPKAQWIGCRNMFSGLGSPASYTECYQWFVAPTDLDNANPDPDLAPDIINNSWSCPESEGCTEPDILRLVVENVHAAGILTVHSAGNSGSACSTIKQPAAIYDDSFTIGATDSNDMIASYSSRGPVTIDGSNRLKPEITAPGSNIRSAYLGGGYAVLSGTSMAAPHVAGSAALLLEAYPDLRGKVDNIEEILERTAFTRLTNENCGGTANAVPNNTYGWGRVDALSAYQKYPHDLFIHKTASTEVISPTETITYTLTITHTHYLKPTTNLVLIDELPKGTIFQSSDTPYTLQDDILTWKNPALDPGKIWSVQFVVTAIDSDRSEITNSFYQVTSDQVLVPVSGPVVVTRLLRDRFYLPIILR